MNKMITRTEIFGDSTLLYTKVNGEDKQFGIVDKERYGYSGYLLGYGDVYRNENRMAFSTSDQAIEAIVNKYKEINQ